MLHSVSQSHHAFASCIIVGDGRAEECTSSTIAYTLAIGGTEQQLTRPVLVVEKQEFVRASAETNHRIEQYYGVRKYVLR